MLIARPSLLLTVNILMVLLLKLAHISSNFMQIILRMFNRYIFPCNVEAVSRKYSVKKGVLKNFVKVTEKKPVSELFKKNKVTGLRPSTLLKKRLRHRTFSCQFCESFKCTFFTEYLRWMLLPILMSLDSERQ